jgi:hypothetical protein
MKITANNYAGRKDERAIANLLDSTLPGPRFPTSERELLDYYQHAGLSPALAAKDKFSDWMGRDKARIAGTASAVRGEYERLRQRMAYAADYKSLISMPSDATLDQLEEVATSVAEPGLAQAQSAALAMIRDLAANGVGSGGGVTIDEVLWGATHAIDGCALNVLGIDVWIDGPSSGVNELRDKYALRPLRRTPRKGWRSVWEL